MTSSYYDHPLFGRKYRILTPAMKDLQRFLQKLVFTDFLGAAVWGYTRAGKTEAIKYAMSNLKTPKGEKIPFYFHSGEKHTVGTDNKFYSSLLSVLGHPFANSGTAIRKFHRCLGIFADAAAYNADAQVVLVMDNAEKLHPSYYEFLSDLHDRLHENSVNLSVLLVGSPVFRTIINDFSGPSGAHIRGRFLLDVHQFHGIQSQDELTVLLKAYDEELTHPKGSEVTYTQHFLKDAYTQDGFRLASLAPNLWNAFRERRDKHLYREWPMKFFVNSIRILLGYTLPSLNTPLELTHDLIVTATIEGGLTDARKKGPPPEF